MPKSPLKILPTLMMVSMMAVVFKRGRVILVICWSLFVEIKKKVYNKVVQTIAIFPHFVSWTVVAMFMTISTPYMG